MSHFALGRIEGSCIFGPRNLCYFKKPQQKGKGEKFRGPVLVHEFFAGVLTDTVNMIVCGVFDMIEINQRDIFLNCGAQHCTQYSR